jgi:hypothetical protein
VVCLIAFSFAIPAVATAQIPPPPADPPESSAAAQISALIEVKKNLTPAQRKIDSSLLMAVKRQQGDAIFHRLPDFRVSATPTEEGLIEVDLRARVDDGLLAAIEATGGSIVNSHPRYRAVRAWIPLHAVETIAALPQVTNIRPADLATTNKIDTSEGDVTHAASTARSTYSVDGSGVTIGVLSDSIEALASLQSSGDLPAVTVLPGQSGSGSSEGTAMLEIVHDLAPGAELYFATAFGGQAQFAQNILDLQAAGCDVIVDDIFYFAEGVFQDDNVAAAVDTVTAAGVQYYSSAGNSGNLNDAQSGVWEGDFSATTTPGVLAGNGDALDFGGGDAGNQVTADSPSLFILQWSDPLGGSGNDYDLYLLDSAMTTVVGAGFNPQDGNDYPIEFIDSQGLDHTGFVLVVLKFSGADRMIHLNTNRGRLEHGTDGQTAGHAAARGAFGVAAVDWFLTQTGGSPNPFDGTESVETFSSDGPRRVHYLADGTPITPGNFSSSGGELRQKPDIAAADGVSTATPGFNPFFGTSAAAPHAAAIGALLRQANPSLTPAEVRAIFESTALDIEAAGVDRDSGSGIVMADLALAAVLSGDQILIADFEDNDFSEWTSVVPDD